MSGAALFDAIGATWPAASQSRLGGVVLREGAGGGGRVSAATLADPAADLHADLPAAEAAMRAAGQVPLFMIRDGLAGEAAADAALAARGYRIVDPTLILTGPAQGPADPRCTAGWPVPADAAAFWAGAGIGPARLAVMGRAAGPRAVLACRIGGQVAGAAFVACDGPRAMLHALEVGAAFRRQGLARALMAAAGAWAQAQGARDIAVLVTEANAPARALYAGLGMAEAGRYHYRQPPA